MDDEDTEAVKQEIRFVKQESLAATRNALRIASEAEETGRQTLGRLGTQSERLAQVELDLDSAANQNRLAEDKAARLKRLNRSIFRPGMSNPFGGRARADEAERRIQERHERQRAEREHARLDAYNAQQRVGKMLGQRQQQRADEKQHKATLLERSRYQFEADEDDHEAEQDIDANLDSLSSVTGRLRGLAMATSTEIATQNAKLDAITHKGDALDTRLHLNSRRLDRV